MPATVEDVKQLIQEKFPNSDVSGLDWRDQRVTGIIRWQGFKGMKADDRYNRVVSAIHDKFGSRSLSVGILLPLAPGEDD